jgi:hypothetical protein
MRQPRPDRPAPRWPAAAQTAAACVVHHRSLYRTRPESLDSLRPAGGAALAIDSRRTSTGGRLTTASRKEVAADARLVCVFAPLV